jgi:hypothetical protein
MEMPPNSQAIHELSTYGCVGDVKDTVCMWEGQGSDEKAGGTRWSGCSTQLEKGENGDAKVKRRENNQYLMPHWQCDLLGEKMSAAALLLLPACCHLVCC